MSWLGTLKKVRSLFRRKYKDFYLEENKKAEDTEESPSGKYTLTISIYSTGENTWEYSRGQVFQGLTEIADVRRNYSLFPFAWIENHADGHDYLICGEDYQGQTIIQLDTGKRLDYLPRAAVRGAGFCMVDFHPSPDGRILATGGCVWGCPYEVRFFDFSNPMNWSAKQLGASDYGVEFIRWIDNESAEYGAEVEYYKPLNIPEAEAWELCKAGKISEEDFNNEEENYETRYEEKLVWTKP